MFYQGLDKCFSEMSPTGEVLYTATISASLSDGLFYPQVRYGFIARIRCDGQQPLDSRMKPTVWLEDLSLTASSSQTSAYNHYIEGCCGKS